MKYKDYKIILEETLNSSEIISTALENSGLGLSIIRQNKTKDNDETSNYKVDGHTVEGFLLYEDSPMKDEGYSEKDGNAKVERLCDEFSKLGGNVTSKGSINKDSTIEFENFNIRIKPITLNSAVDGSGFKRIYAIIKTE